MLNPPAPNGNPFQRFENQPLHQQAQNNHHRQTGKDLVGIQLIAVLENIPAQATLTRRCPKHQFGRNQGTPGKGPDQVCLKQ